MEPLDVVDELRRGIGAEGARGGPAVQRALDGAHAWSEPKLRFIPGPEGGSVMAPA